MALFDALFTVLVYVGLATFVVTAALGWLCTIWFIPETVEAFRRHDEDRFYLLWRSIEAVVVAVVYTPFAVGAFVL